MSGSNATSALNLAREICRPPPLPLPVGEVNPIHVEGLGHVSNPPHWKKAAEAMECSHVDEVRRMIGQFYQARKVVLRGTTLTVGQVTAVTRRGEVKVELDEATAKARVEESAK